MNAPAFDRGAIALGVLAVLSPLFSLSSTSNTNFVAVHGVGLVAFLVLGVLGIVGGLTHSAPVVVLAGGAAAAAGVLQFAQFGRSSNVLEGNGSTGALFLTLALGWLVIGLERNATASTETAGEEAPLTQR